MVDDTSGQFDDPALKSALRRVCRWDAAPPDLRARVAGLMAAERSQPLRAWWRPGLGVAMAAVLLLSIVLFTPTIRGFLGGGGQKTPSLEALAAAIVARHDGCYRDHLNQHHMLACDKGNLNAIRQELTRSLGHRALAADLSGRGWRLDGAALCPVGNTQAAHLLFLRGTEQLSVFSIPTRDLPVAPGPHCVRDCCVEGRWVCGFVQDGGLYVVVGYGPESSQLQAEVKSLRDQFRTDFSALTVGLSITRLVLAGP